MKKYFNKIAVILTALIVSVILVACNDDAKIASKNISKGADNFEINRRVIFYNGITNQYILSIEGRCSITKDNRDNQLEVICKVGSDSYKKHFLGISDNVTYFVEQLEPAKASAYHYRVTFKPQTIIPDIDFRGDADELKSNPN